MNKDIDINVIRDKMIIKIFISCAILNLLTAEGKNCVLKHILKANSQK